MESWSSDTSLFPNCEKKIRQNKLIPVQISRNHLTSLTITVKNIGDATSSCITLTALRLLTWLFFFPPPYIHIILERRQDGSSRLEIWRTKHIPNSFKQRLSYLERMLKLLSLSKIYNRNWTYLWYVSCLGIINHVRHTITLYGNLAFLTI